MLTPAIKSKILFSFLMSGCMALAMSGLMTLLHSGIDSFSVSNWMHAFVMAHGIAFVLVLILAPLIGKLVAKIMK